MQQGERVGDRPRLRDILQRDLVLELRQGIERTMFVRLYSDLREFLAERTDIDAVLSATGDRWHALAAIWAMRRWPPMRAFAPTHCATPTALSCSN